MTTPRPEYPRPQFQREDWQNLNGTWRFAFDDENVGLGERWYENPSFDREITVPFAFQSALSGIQDTSFHDVVWYQRNFSVIWERVILHFGAVDYQATVWVNGQFATFHEGGHVPFSVEITHLLTDGENSLVVRAEDSSTDREQPRGKQYWEPESKGIHYTRTTGIWQTVWLEPVSSAYLAELRITPSLADNTVTLDYIVDGEFDSIEADVLFGGQPVASVSSEELQQTILIVSPHLWSPESPNLYSLVIRVKSSNTVMDEVHSYFGMRSISVEDGKVLLNGEPYTMKLVLDQGYHPEGILTFPSDEALIEDIEYTKALGFNGARKHQKVEEPRYLYHADRLGLLVWGEMANVFVYSEKAIRRITAEWQEAVRRDYNHPCIVAWVPLNESWGVRKLVDDPRRKHHLTTLYYLTKSLDSTRLVMSNDGWEHTVSDLFTIHDYEGKGDILRERYATLESILAAQPAKHPLFAEGYSYNGEPILLTEIGGIGYQIGGDAGWGYTTAEGDEDFVARYKDAVTAIMESPHVQGFCYTQITDVEQEINGLLTYDRRPKVDPALIKAINDAL